MTAVSGTWLTPGGAPLAGAVWLEISVPVVGGVPDPRVPYVLPLAGGVCSGTVPGNDTLTPANTFYRVTVVSPEGVPLVRRQVRVTGSSANLSTLPEAS